MSEPIAFDFGGVCCTNVGAPVIGEPIPEVLSAIRALRAAGHRIVIYSHRPQGGQSDLIRKWLSAHGVEVDEVRTDKMLYRVFVDDRAISFPYSNGDLLQAILARVNG